MYFFSLEFSLEQVPQSVLEQVLLALALLALLQLALALLALLQLALAFLALHAVLRLALALLQLALLALLQLALALLALHAVLRLALLALLQLDLYQVLGISFLCAQLHYTHYSAQLYHAYLF
jgi:hypothetical protein